MCSKVLLNMTTEDSQHLEAIQDIRNMMRKSTRFLSLSGLSGVFAGIFAMIGATVAWFYLDFIREHNPYTGDGTVTFSLNEVYLNFILIAGSVLLLSVLMAYYFSNKKARKQGLTLFDHTALRALVNLCIPLGAGGVFCIALLYHGSVVYIAPAMLLFYGMALINASKYTYTDIRYFGICEIVLGLVNSFNLGHGLLYWTIGFGVLHIVYGASMWLRYERKEEARN